MRSQDQDKDSKFPSSINESTLIRVLKWLGTGLFVIASISMALFGHKYIDLQLYIFITYVLGAFCWLTVSIMLRDKPQIVLYLTFASVDITGIIMRLI